MVFFETYFSEVRSGALARVLLSFEGIFYFLEKIFKKSVDITCGVRYNGESLSKSAFPTSTKRYEKRGILEVAKNALQIFLQIFY